MVSPPKSRETDIKVKGTRPFHSSTVSPPKSERDRGERERERAYTPRFLGSSEEKSYDCEARELAPHHAMAAASSRGAAWSALAVLQRPKTELRRRLLVMFSLNRHSNPEHSSSQVGFTEEAQCKKKSRPASV
ncbi:hypothetical protein EVAR_65754_1 [Eumeta japonica]|uniref:Uncharacterized protein n=1 Tax=Eumeta variegata TaxID=151549 RepID=A0A4C1ZL78_EUMVA|nr:hypothetical protein EVAR_65754_1 [Eumeta japonica]